jgi:hypothetical protein
MVYQHLSSPVMYIVNLLTMVMYMQHVHDHGHPGTGSVQVLLKKLSSISKL